MDATQTIICYASDISAGTRIPIAESIRPSVVNGSNSTNSTEAKFEVTYLGFTEEAKLAFQMALNIWSAHLSSDVVIKVTATWENLGPGVLGAASWNTAFRGFEGAKEVDTWYPIALAEKMAGVDLNNPNEPDIIASFNKSFNWYLGMDGNPGATQHDLVSVVLHELGHGLGFTDSYNFNESNNTWGVGIQNFPFIFDLSVENGSGTSLYNLRSSPNQLGTALTSGSVFFDSPSEVQLSSKRPELYAPSMWNPGSSISHLDEAVYPAGNSNSLMSPQIAANEVIHNPGSIVKNIFGDMGWEYTYIRNIIRPNTDDIAATEYPVIASIRSDLGYKSESVKLFYSRDGFTSDSNEVPMMPTNNANQFVGNIPSNNTEGQTYSYYISVEDNKDRKFSKPSILTANRYLTFTSGADNTAPEIFHSPPNFVRTTATKFSIKADILDFLPTSTQLEYQINSGPLLNTSFKVTDAEKNEYTADVDLTNLNLQDDDIFKYRIISTDLSQNSNTSTFPASGFIEVRGESGFEPANNYKTDFNNVNDISNDFFISNNFSVRDENGFLDGSLHSDHPYKDGSNSLGRSDYTVELKVPIIVQSRNPVISFDEVVLVEPGETDSEFGDDEFYDYVIVEASKDGGETWIPLVDGYDSRARTSWFNAYMSGISAPNSTTAGTSSLFESREINILDNELIQAGDIIQLRFRMFADSNAHGWGWAIDNLNIQFDDDKPSIKHSHLNFVSSLNDIILNASATDNGGMDSVGVLIRINGVEQSPIGLGLVSANEYATTLDISSLQIGDLIEYRLAAFDDNEPEANVSYLPDETSFLQIPIINFNQNRGTYSNDFNSESNDLVGNYFRIETPSEFGDGAIHSSHPVPNPFGKNSRSTFTYTLKTPIRVSSTRPFIIYDEIVLLDPSSDYVALEGSKDGGMNWFEIRRYSTNDQPNVWSPVFQNGGSGNPSLYRTRTITLTDSPDLNTGDVVILRFRLERRSTQAAWGWAIDNLEVQTQVIAGLEDQDEMKFVSVYPNPVKDGRLNIQVSNPSVRAVDYSIVSLDGQSKMTGQNLELDSDQKASIDVSSLPSGLFVLKVVQGETAKVYKVMKLD